MFQLGIYIFLHIFTTTERGAYSHSCTKGQDVRENLGVSCMTHLHKGDIAASPSGPSCPALDRRGLPWTDMDKDTTRL